MSNIQRILIIAGPFPFVIAAMLFISTDRGRILAMMLIVILYFCFYSVCLYMLDRPTKREKEHQSKSMT